MARKFYVLHKYYCYILFSILWLGSKGHWPLKENASFAVSGLWLGLKYFKGKSYLVDISAFAVGKDALN